MKKSLAVALGLGILGVGPSVGAEPCATYKQGVEVGRLTDVTLDELSGLARASDGDFWAHNDSGDEARVFKVKFDGTVVGTWTLAGVDAVDFEDMANAPCADGRGSCLVVADIGNNLKNREVLSLHRFSEPNEPGVDVVVETTRFMYPDGPRDAEAVFAQGDAAFVISKEGNQSGLYRVPWSTNEVVTAERLVQFAEPLAVTGADLSADGKSLLVRGYFSIAQFEVLGPERWAETLSQAPDYAPFRAERQGEAVVFRGGAPGFITIGESQNAVVNWYDCAAPPVSEDPIEPVDPSDPNDASTPPAAPLAPDSCGGWVPWWVVFGPGFGALGRRRRGKNLATSST